MKTLIRLLWSGSAMFSKPIYQKIKNNYDICMFCCSVVEKVIRERFAKAVARGTQELRVKRATSSPINGLIENAVIEVIHEMVVFLIYLKKTTTGCCSSVSSMSALQAVVPPSILPSGTFFRGKIISLFH